MTTLPHEARSDGEDITSDEDCRRLRSRYHGMCSLVDFSVGQILAAVEETGQRENTIIVYTSDHGDQVGDHGLWGKSSSYEGSVRIPLVLHLPGVGPGRVDALVSQIDLAPTMLDSLGVPIPGHLQGRSWLPVLRGDQATDTLGDVFVEFEGDDGLPKPGPDSPFPPEWHDQSRGPWRSIVTADGWKLNLSTTDRGELFDLNSDPAEIRNLFGERGQSGRVRDLTRRMCDWQEGTEDAVGLV